MNLTKKETAERGDQRLFWLDVDEVGLDEILEEHGIVPCHLHRDLTTDRLKANAERWVNQIVRELAEEFRNN